MSLVPRHLNKIDAQRTLEASGKIIQLKLNIQHKLNGKNFVGVTLDMSKQSIKVNTKEFNS